MQECVFCQIAAGEAEADMVHSNDQFLAFLDIHPRVSGHTLVVPKRHYRWVDEVPNIGGLFSFAKLISDGIKQALQPSWMQFVTIGERVPHAHVHVLPRYGSDPHGTVVNFGYTETMDAKQMNKTARAIRRAVLSISEKGGET